MMRTSYRGAKWAFLSGLIAFLLGTVFAQGNFTSITHASAEAQDTSQHAAPELAHVLDQFREASSKILLARGSCTATELNHLFKVKTVSKVDFAIDASGPWRIDIKSVGGIRRAVKLGDQKSDQPYEQVAGKSNRWIFTSDSDVVIYEEDKTYLRDNTTSNVAAVADVKSRLEKKFQPAAFLFLNLDEISRCYDLSIGQEQAETVTVVAKNRHKRVVAIGDSSTFDLENKQVSIELSKTTHLPKSIHYQFQGYDLVYNFDQLSILEDGQEAVLETARHTILDLAELQSYRSLNSN